jgi:BirA family biotin operon repressor/biotin-[acetyl-CoA-carboxylase] ligase
MDAGALNKDLNATRRLNVDRLQNILDTQLFGIGNRLLYISTVGSTNTQAMSLALQGAEEGVVVLTDSQTAGKGRLGRRWFDRAGYNALTSTILRPLFPPYLLVMMASLAVVDAIASVCDVTATIKWPNDVLIDDRKVAGILIETSRDQAGSLVAIVGIGVNVNGQAVQPDTHETASLPITATTLEAACGHEVSRELFIGHLLRTLEAMYLALQQEARSSVTDATGLASHQIQEHWRQHLSTLGRTIQVRQGDTILQGIAEDVNDNGELYLRCHSGERVCITWGDVGYPTE